MVRTKLEDIADFLVNRGLVTAKGVDIHQGMMPDEQPPSGLNVLLVQGGGLSADRTHDTRRILNPGVLVVVRADAGLYTEGLALAESIYDAMLDLTNTAIDGQRYIGTNPVGDVADLGRDEADRWKFTMRFVVKTA